MASGGFNADRFREAVTYIAWRMRSDERFGRVKMAKTLFYADFEAYADDGVAVTGALYEHWPFGPFPPVLYDIEKELECAGHAELRPWKLVGKAPPKTSYLSVYHRTLLDLKMDDLAQQSSKQVSDESHEHPAWVVTRNSEVIPYAAAHVPTRPSPRAMEIARHHAAKMPAKENIPHVD